MNLRTHRPTDEDVTETPGHRMTRLAGPSTLTSDIAVWHLRTDPGATGPAHSVTHDQVLHVLSGAARITVEEHVTTVVDGDTVLIPGGQLRQVANGSADQHLEAIVTMAAGGRAVLADGTDRGPLPWAT